jgi:hypothetical protein
MTDGTWIVTDFGDDAKGRNAIKIAQKELGLDFRNAVLEVASHYGITENYQSASATFNQWPATPDEPEGAKTYLVKPTEKHELQSVFTDSAWKALGKDEEERIKEKNCSNIIGLNRLSISDALLKEKLQNLDRTKNSRYF